MLLSKEDKNIMSELENASNSILAFHKRESTNTLVLNQRLQRLQDAKDNFSNHFKL